MFNYFYVCRQGEGGEEGGDQAEQRETQNHAGRQTEPEPRHPSQIKGIDINTYRATNYT